MKKIYLPNRYIKKFKWATTTSTYINRQDGDVGLNGKNIEYMIYPERTFTESKFSMILFSNKQNELNKFIKDVI